MTAQVLRLKITNVFRLPQITSSLQNSFDGNTGHKSSLILVAEYQGAKYRRGINMASLASSPVHMEIPIKKLSDIIRIMLIREIIFK
jgi:hypothetical protein